MTTTNIREMLLLPSDLLLWQNLSKSSCKQNYRRRRFFGHKSTAGKSQTREAAGQQQLTPCATAAATKATLLEIAPRLPYIDAAFEKWLKEHGIIH